MARRAFRYEGGLCDEPLGEVDRRGFETFDMLYRSLCALLYNYVPTSGHPGGSISSGRIVAAMVFDGLDYDLASPERQDADVLCYAAGHKVMGLYAMWALRDEIARLLAPELLATRCRDRLRLEDLLGFRANPTAALPLYSSFGSRSLDGHPTPATPFVRLASGASGVGLASAIGLAIAARDHYGENCPRVHVLEGEGGLTPGRVSEALAAAGTASLGNVFAHVDFNQSSIDSDRVCREGALAGDYVQWDPGELFFLHDWNVIEVADGHDFAQVLAAQHRARAIDNGQPTAVVYRTRKGWNYGIEGRASHGTGHKLCSAGFYEAVSELSGTDSPLPNCELAEPRCMGPAGGAVREECFWSALELVRRRLEQETAVLRTLGERLVAARRRLDSRALAPRAAAPCVEAVYELAAGAPSDAPLELRIEPGATTTLRETLGRCLRSLNKASGGALFTASADLLGSTSAATVAADFPPGFWNAASNPGSRVLSIGGICEDAIAGVLSGVSAFGTAIGVGSSYGAFIAPLGHVAARLHAIGAQARSETSGEPYRSLVLICGHVGLATGEDGPTHADPQALQLIQENFPPGSAVTLTPWEPQEIWPLLATALSRRPAFIAPFVTRPELKVLERVGLGLAPAEAAVAGVYLLRAPRDNGDVTIVLQESAVAYTFVSQALPMLEADGIDPRVYYVASPELFDALEPERRHAIFPEQHAFEAIGITGFTLPTMYRWVRSDAGREATLHPYRHGRYPGSGKGEDVLAEAGLDGASQYTAVKRFLEKALVAV